MKAAILACGSGKSVQSILTAIERRRIDLDVQIVISYEDCEALRIAERFGYATRVVPRGRDSREQYDEKLSSLLDVRGVKFVITSEFMHLFGKDFVHKYSIVNGHPSLLPAFPGMHDQVYRAVISSRLRESGVTIHRVDEGMDTGKVLKQKKVLVLSSDTPVSLKEKCQEAEAQLYVEVLEVLFASKTIQI